MEEASAGSFKKMMATASPGRRACGTDGPGAVLYDVTDRQSALGCTALASVRAGTCGMEPTGVRQRYIDEVRIAAHYYHYM